MIYYIQYQNNGCYGIAPATNGQRMNDAVLLGKY
jgi:hypothetical protein